MPVTNEQIVMRARAYLGTPFVPKGRSIGKALDCIGLVLMVAQDLGLKDIHGIPVTGSTYSDYSDQPVGNFVHDECFKNLIYVPVRKVQPGNVVTVAVGTAPCHVGFIGSDRSGALTLIHAYNGGRQNVVEIPIDIKWFRRLRGGFTFPEVV
jgi:hypothetical protein